MSKGIHGEEKRLRQIFQRALWIALAAPMAIPFACSAGGTTSTGSGEGGSDTTSTSVATGTGGAGPTDGGASGTGGMGCVSTVIMPDPPDPCGTVVRLPCGLPAGVMPTTECDLYLKDCSSLCPGSFFTCHVVSTSCVDGGTIVDNPTGVDVDCVTCPNGVGRVPAGLARARATRAAGALGDYFAAAAHLEAASVHAFRRLRVELVAHRAPARLQRSARRAQRDEVRHAHRVARMARRFGGVPAAVRVEPVAPRALDAIALENAVEGCVRETFGALVASFQAANAGDPAIARMMAAIARDETRHAALSWSVARWARRQLGAEARVELAARCRDTVETLRREGDVRVADELIARAGLPTAEQRRALLDALEGQLPWRSAST